MSATILVLQTILSLGLNLLIARLRVNKRLKRVLIGLVIANEVRGAWFAYEGVNYLF